MGMFGKKDGEFIIFLVQSAVVSLAPVGAGMRWNQFGRLARGFGTCGDVTQDHKMRAELARPIRRIYVRFSTALTVPFVSSLYEPGLTLRCFLLYQHILCHFRHICFRFLFPPPMPRIIYCQCRLFDLRHLLFGLTLMKFVTRFSAIPLCESHALLHGLQPDDMRYRVFCKLKLFGSRFALNEFPFCQLSCLNQWVQ